MKELSNKKSHALPASFHHSYSQYSENPGYGLPVQGVQLFLAQTSTSAQTEFKGPHSNSSSYNSTPESPFDSGLTLVF